MVLGDEMSRMCRLRVVQKNGKIQFGTQVWRVTKAGVGSFEKGFEGGGVVVPPSEEEAPAGRAKEREESSSS